MTEREVKQLINESIDELRNYQKKALSRISNRALCENDIQEGRKLLEDILKGALFEDNTGREPQYESLVGEEVFEELRKELSRTSNVVKLLKGDISPKVYEKRQLEIDEKCL